MPTDRRRSEHSDMTPEQRSDRARKAAHARWDNTPYDRDLETKPGRDAFEQTFRDRVDPEGRLDPVTREKRAQALKSRHYAELANLRKRKR